MQWGPGEERRGMRGKVGGGGKRAHEIRHGEIPGGTQDFFHDIILERGGGG